MSALPNNLISSTLGKRCLATMQTTTNIMAAKLPEMPKDLPIPPLPTISNSQLERQVFTHSSAVPRSNKSLFEMGGLEDNEKLEHVGDSLVSESCMSRRVDVDTNITLMLHQLYPNIQPGGATVH
jgi:dsRNA-specific ribonuclease